MNIDINLVKQLRDATFAPLGDCKNALVEAEGDLEKAQEILRKKWIAKAWKKAGRETNEGLIKVAHNNWKTYVLKLLCETDFVAKNETFLGLFDKFLKIFNNFSFGACFSMIYSALSILALSLSFSIKDCKVSS